MAAPLIACYQLYRICRGEPLSPGRTSLAIDDHNPTRSREARKLTVTRMKPKTMGLPRASTQIASGSIRNTSGKVEIDCVLVVSLYSRYTKAPSLTKPIEKPRTIQRFTANRIKSCVI